VRPDRGVEVVLPARALVTEGDIARIVGDRSEWIAAALRNLEQTRPEEKPPFERLCEVPWRGGVLAFDVVIEREPHTSLVDGRLVLRVPDATAARVAFEDWAKREATRAIGHSVKRWAKAMNVRPSRIRLGDARTRWGSCSSKGSLNFSWRLVMAPPDVLEYVVVHELCHILHPNHSHGFWSAVARWFPEYREQLRWLKAHGASLRF
jgi:predicted metal-dependent hydrolase